MGRECNTHARGMHTHFGGKTQRKEPLRPRSRWEDTEIVLR
jgi:hypothetical protein